ncbi:Ger(x)C family spore germination protein [Aquibacillus sp. 3ASR75-11]|uniref:Ger(X)C family spore germination protein n=1 Tax=Terrihalobacillus insolitus TaxID=2950438 RepID=A0A9X4ANA5_9BACI|nr:Ger(x)C family spore germination protein [Terrihalobacillus insolitus]MDC3424330.1 Ger(x)C family spore germination protein [Terrihalobacillus insolitus]
MIQTSNKFLTVLLVFIMVLIMTGCGHIIQPEELTTISLAGFDRDGDEYIITMHILNPNGISTGSAGGDASGEEPVRVLAARGKTITEAIHEANRYNPGHHFWGHLSGILIGEEMAREGMAPIIDALGRSNEMMETAELYITRDTTAKELLSTTTKASPFPAEALRKIAKYSSMHTAIRRTRLNQFLQTISSNPGTVVIPGVKTKSPEIKSSKNGDIFNLTGIAVVSDWKLKGWLDGEEAMGYMWIMEQISHHGFNVPFKSGTISLEALPNHTSINVDVNEKDVKQITVKVKSTVIINEVKDISLDMSKNPIETEKELQEALNKEVKKIVEQTVIQTQTLHADVLQLNEHVRMTSPQLWKKISNIWEQELFPNIEVQVDAEISIRDIGELYRSITKY